MNRIYSKTYLEAMDLLELPAVSFGQSSQRQTVHGRVHGAPTPLLSVNWQQQTPVCHTLPGVCTKSNTLPSVPRGNRKKAAASCGNKAISATSQRGNLKMNDAVLSGRTTGRICICRLSFRNRSCFYKRRQLHEVLVVKRSGV